MGIGIRAMQGLVATAAFLITALGGVLGWLSSPDLGTFIGEMLPFPLLLPLLGGLGVIISLQLIPVFTSGNTDDDGDDSTDDDDDADDSDMSQISERLIKAGGSSEGWNSRSNLEKDPDN